MEDNDKDHSDDGSYELVNYEEYVSSDEDPPANRQSQMKVNEHVYSDGSYEYVLSDEGDNNALTKGEAYNSSNDSEEDATEDMDCQSNGTESSYMVADDCFDMSGRFNFKTIDYQKADVHLEFPAHIKRREHMEIKDIVKDNVLPFLPAKSLYRYRLVSKEWDQWISSPFLAHKQGHQFKKTSGFFQDFGWSVNFLSLDKSAYGVPSPNLCFLPEVVTVKSSCNGLLLCQGQDVYYICNPANKEWQMLPSPKYYHGKVPKIALVFEPSSLNFEPCFQAICAFSLPLFEGGAVISFEIYNSTTTSWKLCEVDVIDLDDSQLEENSFYMNGVVYWKTTNGELLAFDVKNEIYSVLPLPTERTREGTVSQMDGELCYIEATHEAKNECRVDIYGGTLMSSKRSITIDLLNETDYDVGSNFQVLACVSNDVLTILSRRYLYTCNVKDQKVEVAKFMLNSFGVKYFPYVNSLVSVAAKEAVRDIFSQSFDKGTKK